MKYLALFCHLLNIRPWEWEHLEYGEAIALMAWCDRHVKVE